MSGSLPIIGPAVQAVGSLMSAGSRAAGLDSQANASMWNAQAAEVQARQARQQAGEREDMQRRKARETMGTMLAAGAESGVGMEGSFADLFRQSLYDAEADALSIRYQGELQAAGLRNQAEMEKVNARNTRNQASMAMRAGYLNAAGSLLNSGANYMKATG